MLKNIIYESVKQLGTRLGAFVVFFTLFGSGFKAGTIYQDNLKNIEIVEMRIIKSAEMDELKFKNRKLRLEKKNLIDELNDYEQKKSK